MSEQSIGERTAIAFAKFALAHTGCGDEVIEARPDERSVVCCCVRCGEIRVFEGEPERETA